MVLKERSSLGHRMWEDMDSNILNEIIARVPICDLFHVSSVCQSWALACWDFLFWRRNVFDLSATDTGSSKINCTTLETLYEAQISRVPGLFGKFDSAEEYNQVAMNLLGLLQSIMDDAGVDRRILQDWLHSVRTVILPFDLEILDKHLLYIAERLHRIRCLLLLDCSRITLKGFSMVIPHWKHLREVYLGPLSEGKFFQFIEQMGQKCPQLKILHTNQRTTVLNTENASRIAKSLPTVKKIAFKSCFVLPSGVVTLFRIMPHLDEISFALAMLVSLDRSDNAKECEQL